MVRIRVRYFAAAAEAAGLEEEIVEVGDGTLAGLRALLGERYGAAMQQVLCAGSFLVDGVVRRDGGPLVNGVDGVGSADAGSVASGSGSAPGDSGSAAVGSGSVAVGSGSVAVGSGSAAGEEAHADSGGDSGPVPTVDVLPPFAGG
ncbi:MAG: hypothetical protein QM606_05650 [Leucobacter sp.]